MNNKIIHITDKTRQINPTSNIALVFIKPHAVTNDEVISFVCDEFNRKGMHITSSGYIGGSEIEKKGLIDRHYRSIANDTFADPGKLILDTKAQALFTRHFNVAWPHALAENKVINAFEALKTLGCSAGELNERWLQYGFTEIADVRISHFKKEDRFIINGFYPSLREKYTAADSGIIYYQVDLGRNSWKAFREFIGGTNPSEANSATIRGSLYRDREKYSIAMNTQDNAIHASASPLEALYEKMEWLGTSLVDDPLGRNLITNGLQVLDILQWRDNPEVYYEGSPIKLFSLLKNTDTPQAAEILLRILGALV